MHAWEAIQKTLNHIEENISEDIQIDELAEIAALSVFYFQRLFSRLVKKPVREYIKQHFACSTKFRYIPDKIRCCNKIVAPTQHMPWLPHALHNA